MANAQTMKRKPQAVDKAAKPSTEKPVARAADNKAPGYLQAKMKVSQPGDAHEQQADQVAERVSRAAKPDTPVTGADKAIQRATLQPGEDLGDQQQTLSRKPDQTKPESTLSKKPQNNLAKKADTQSLQAKGDVPQIDQATEERINSLRGNGEPLPEAVKNDMQQQLQADFSAVRIHNSGEAAALAAGINARAFTVGNDIFFATGEYAPDSAEGRKLLAHELTHVVQQSDGIAGKIMRANGDGSVSTTAVSSSATEPPVGVTPIEPTPDGGPYEFSKEGKRYKYVATSPKELHVPEVRIPNFKQRHQSLHPTPLIRERGERSTNQRQNWRNNFNTAIVQPLESTIDSARRRGGVANDGGQDVYFFKGTRNQQLMLFGTREQLLEAGIFPFWDRQQETRSFQVDHRREDQLGGADELANYELLDAQANGSSGSQIAREINSEIGSAISVLQSTYYRNLLGGGSRRISGNPSYIKENYNLQFNSVHYNLGNVANGDRYWSVEQITQGQHFRQFRPLTEREVAMFGNPRRPMLFTSPMGGIGIRAPESEGQRVTIWPRVTATGPLNIIDEEHATLPVDAYRAGDNPNGLQASYPGVAFQFKPVPGMASSSSYKSWAIDKAASLAAAQAAGSGGVFQSLRLPGLSPIRVDELDLDPALGFVGRGKLLPSVPVFAQADIDVLIQGGEIRLQKTFNFEEINIPSPFEIYHSSITAFMGTQGLGLEGAMGFGINRLGEGELRAEISTAEGLALDGRFGFDQRIFGEGTSAEVRVGYRNEAWSMGGTLTIPEGKVPGISSASINVDYAEGAGLSARGDATLSIPGVERGTLEITQSAEQGFSMGGSFNLSSDVPGIRGGSISAAVREKPDGSGYAVSARGEAQPDIPGIESQLMVSYDDGLFTAEFSGGFQRGMLAGNATVGVTNRAVGEDGRASGEPLPDGALNVYGNGSATLQIAPWLQGTVGITFAPNGEVTVVGEIGLPSAVELLPRKQVERNLFSVGTSIPIVPGIVARIAGGADAVAGFGPGQLDQMNLRVEYNPSHEENTHISGGAHLNVPADAGVRLFVRAGIGLGIPGASATGGLEIGGQLGIAGAAEAAVNFNWTPTTGLEINAEGYIHAQPRFVFDISGYVEVEALWITVYEQRWNFASFEYGSDLTFGVRFPIHYQEGQPFDISLSDVQFETPNIDTDAILSGLIDRIA